MDPLLPRPTDTVLVGVVAGLTLVGIAFGRLPGARLNRAAVALAGAALVAVLRGEGPATAWHSIDGNVLALLFGLMVLSASLARSGAYRRLVDLAASRPGDRAALLVGLVFATGLASALFLNDTVVLLLTAPVISLARRLGARPLPYLLALAMAANAGSVATLTGNPQDVAVASAAGIGYVTFLAALGPVALGSLAIVAGTILVLFRRDFASRGAPAAASASSAPARPVRRRPLVLNGGVAAATVAAFVAGVPPATAALAGAAVVLVLAGRGAGALLRAVDVEMLGLFAGLFVVVSALASLPAVATLLALGTGSGSLALAAVATLTSNLVSNVPAVLLMLPMVGGGSAPLTLAMASTLAGNLTLVGSVANLALAETARRHGVDLPFAAHARVGVPVTLLTLALGVAWLALR